jgi:hemerythrin-like domain-containing protein
MENVEHHVEEEEGEMFKKARQVLSKEDAETLGTRMEEAKKEQKARAA